MRENKVRQLTYGAMMAVLFVILVIFSTLPLVAVILVWFMPLPIILYVYKYGLKSSILVVVVSLIPIFLTIGLLSVFIGLLFAVIGCTIGFLIRHNKSKVEIFLHTSVATLLMILGTIYVYMQFTSINLLTELDKMIKKSMADYLKISEELAKSLNQKSPITEEMANKITNTMIISLPSTFIIGAFVFALIIIALNFPILRKLGLPVKKFGQLKDLQLPRIILLFYFVVILIQLLMKPEMGTYLYAVYINASAILSLLLFVQGVSFIHFMVNRSSWPKPVAWIFTIIALPFNSYITLLGIIDLGFHLRILLGDKKQK